MKILFIGDVVGSPGRAAVRGLVPSLKKERGLQFVIVNAENAAGGSGITASVASELFEAGADVLTSGDHIWKKHEIFDLIASEPRILRPANFPAGAPGSGWGVFMSRGAGVPVGVINLQGRVFMEALESPFVRGRQAAEELSAKAKVIIVDIHAEATSEKVALGWFLDGKVSAVIGTHTHIQTADERLLEEGTAYISDAGMTGPYRSVIGRKIENVLQRFLTSVPVRFEVADRDIQLRGVIVDVDERSGKARSIERISVPYEA